MQILGLQGHFPTKNQTNSSENEFGRRTPFINDTYLKILFTKIHRTSFKLNQIT